MQHNHDHGPFAERRFIQGSAVITVSPVIGSKHEGCRAGPGFMLFGLGIDEPNRVNGVGFEASGLDTHMVLVDDGGSVGFNVAASGFEPDGSTAAGCPSDRKEKDAD